MINTEHRRIRTNRLPLKVANVLEAVLYGAAMSQACTGLR